jgi:hypothetical protein
LETQRTAPIPEKALDRKATRYRDNDRNDNKSSQGGSQKKMKKAARKEQETSVAEEAEGATKTYEENLVKAGSLKSPSMANALLKPGLHGKTKTMASRSCTKGFSQTPGASTTPSSTSSAMRQ